ncbi:penicillin-binding protein 1A [Phosphitispora fastidiosa]|uniref:penicillin-binding protein 1A n=1 Tax=Phosphitispora fastidiosa TaxID=2837202 RepID=UPI001E54FE65|nr:penicillin-binding protein 1A [Phosphitispora fastidiosa]MBU7007318.1 1A family penicillin-binding protein [Phosphitispora fastidiosa]
MLTLPTPKVPVASKVYDVNNQVIATLYRENRVEVPVEKIPQMTRNAFIAVEDTRFYKHFGLDPVRIIGAAWRNLRSGELVEGGSTITQQTVKNLYLSREKTFGRKFREALLAVQMERKYSKDEILELYLNQIYFGHGAYGVEIAAQTYFDKPASELDLAESAMLAGLPKAPNTYSPFKDWDKARDRQKTVLKRMTAAGFITDEQADEAFREKLILKSGRTETETAPYFISEVIQYLTDKYEDGADMLYAEGISVYTTLDLNMQKAAESSFDSVLQDNDAQLDGALAAIEPGTGHIRAMVGGRDFSRSKFNRAVQAKRQPGSAFKPFLYTAAIDRGYTQGSTLTCEYVEFPQDNGKPYKPTDYGAAPYHNRPLTLKEALKISDNIVAVRLAGEITPRTMTEYAHKMGIESDLRPYLSLALGTSEVTPLEMAAAYSTLASGGIKSKPLFILKITDKKGRVIEENAPVTERVISDSTAYLVTDMLSAVFDPGGTAASLSGIISRPAAGKTGTTQNYRDAWFVGYTPHLAASVYIGYDNPEKAVGIPGGKIAGPIWARFMSQALENVPPEQFSVPPDIVTANICTDTGLLATPLSPDTIRASFLKGTEPREYCTLHFFSGFENGVGLWGSWPESRKNLPGKRRGQQQLD